MSEPEKGEAQGKQGDSSVSGIERAGDECYWCGGDLAEGGSIQIKMREDEEKRETCPDCVRDWPPDEVEERYVDTGSDRDETPATGKLCPDCGDVWMDEVDPESTPGGRCWECPECCRSVREGEADA